ncbi:FG-GAP-like repeat-containing protein [Streptomyces sp. NPDC049949]|uniref:FG-GAP-like repeat-containing protein n=1 Tax=Streptomyces sp. NPDC049949 TaxID=3154627 RepID=UPI00342CE910
MSAEEFALAKAKETGRPYELVSARTETSDTWALPTGKWSVKRYGTTVRVRREGAWVAVDPTLAFAPDGRVSPRAAAVQFAFSGGGTDPLLTAVKDGRTLSLTWPSALPRPTLAANVATYTNILPDVDLQLKAEVEGFSQLLVVKTAAAAQHPDLATLKFKLNTVGLSVSTDAASGSINAVDPAGQTAFTASTPMMWDSTTTAPVQTAKFSASAVTVLKSQGAPADTFIAPSGAKDAKMPTAIVGNTLEIKPDQALLKAPATKYPVFIDPSVAFPRQQNWAWAYRAWPNNSYWNTKEDVRVGYESVTGGLSRSFFELDTSDIKGAQIIQSTFRIRETWAWSCTETPVELWTTGPISPQTTWNNQPGRRNLQQKVKAAKGRPECESGNVEFDATQAARESAANGWSAVTLGLYASDEGDTNYWKRFDPKTVTLETLYNNPPDTPSNPGTAPWVPCTEGGSIGNTTVSLYSTITDRDSGNLSADFQLFKAGQSTPYLTQTLSASNGRVATWAIPDDKLPSGSYTWNVRARDQDGSNSAWSQTCKFAVDRARPTEAPKITSAVFPDGSAGWPAVTGKARQSGTFTLQPNGVPDVTWYGYFTDWDTQVQSAPVAEGASHTFTLVPPSAGPHFVYAFSQDKAGNRSDTTAYRFYADRAETVDGPGDLNGDGYRDVWNNDLSGKLLAYTGQGNGKFRKTDSSVKSFAGAQVTTFGHWDDDGYNDLLALQPVEGVSRKDLVVHPNNGQGETADNATKLIVRCAVKDPAKGCSGAGNGPDWTGDDHWYNAEQVIAPGDIGSGDSPDILVKQGKQLWAYFGGVGARIDVNGKPVLVGGSDWDKYTVITPGDLDKDGVPDLWLRDNTTGDIHSTLGKPSTETDRRVDLATWGTQTRTKIGSAITQAAYPMVGSSGDITGDNIPDLWARQADNTLFAWPGILAADGKTVGSFGNRIEIDGIPGARIAPGTALTSGQEISSGNAKLTMQTDGNLVLSANGKPVWATKTQSPGATARMLNDGKLAVYTADGKTVLWNSGTSTPYSYALLHPRGTLVIYNGSGQSLWTSGSQNRPDWNGDGRTDLIGRDANGDMWMYPGTGAAGTGTLGTRSFIGNGWYRDHWTDAYTADLNNDGFTDIIGRNRFGDLYLYPGTGGTGTNTVGNPVLIGNGWNTYNTLGFTDVDGDGRTDVIGRDSSGDLWMYPHTGGSGTQTFGTRVLIGNGWQTYNILGFTDIDGNGRPDVVGRDSSGDLWVYPHTGGTGTQTLGSRILIGNGWNTYSTLGFTDLNGDGRSDIVGRSPQSELYVYPNTSSGGKVSFAGRDYMGVGWNALDIIL